MRGQQAAPQAEPTFRTDANYVLTDVFVTADGKPVTDLTQADFEVQEDGVVQTDPLLRGGPSHDGVGRACRAASRRRWPKATRWSAIRAAGSSWCSSTPITSRAGSDGRREALQTFLKSGARRG